MAGAEDDDHEGPLLRHLCRLLQMEEHRGVAVESRPDRESRGQGDVDAIIRRGPTLMAVEHTRFHSREQKPRILRTLDLVRPIISGAVEKGLPRSVVQVSIPAAA